MGALPQRGDIPRRRQAGFECGKCTQSRGSTQGVAAPVGRIPQAAVTTSLP